MRIALWLSCPVAVTWSVLGFILLFASHQLSLDRYHAISHTKAVLAGMDIGILTLLFASGEFIAAFSCRNTAPKL